MSLERPVSRLLRAVCALFVCCLLSLNAWSQTDSAPSTGDQIVFANGDRLSGKLTRVVGDNVLFHSDIAGDLTLPLSKIRELHTEGNFAVLKHGDPVAVSRNAVPGRIDLEENVVTVTARAAEPQTVPGKSVAFVIDEKTFNENLTHKMGIFKGWNGSMNLGASLTDATIHGGSFTGGVAIYRQEPVLTYFRARNKTILNFQENYGVLTTPAVVSGSATDVQAKTSILHADAERDEYVAKSIYLLGVTSFDHNYAQSLDLQQIYGVGVGWTVFNLPLHQLDLKADLHYEKQQFFDPTLNQNLVGSTFSENYRRTLPYKVSLVQTAAYLPAWNNTNAYSANGSITLLAPLFRRLAVNLTAIDSFLNNPSTGYQKNSLTFTTGLTYTVR